MAYQTLYRRYRPRRFSDVRGQEPVVRALRNAVREDRVGHAYLFSGPRGTGKTSTARILAKALNCENLEDGEPDGTCPSCLAIDAGTSYDVQELDAASNNKVEDVRDLIGRVALGSPGRTKVYILDEVHMLTPAASASLLKTLEEPPPHVVFVLATTDPQKVLDTIRSRTQHFTFHLLSADELAEHVAWVIHDADLDVSPDSIAAVVRQGRGSARDTLSALDQVAAAGGVIEDDDALGDLLDAIAAADAAAALGAVAAAVTAGRDPRVLGEAVLSRLRDIFLVRMGAETSHLPSGEVAQVQAWAEQLGDRATTRALEAVGDALIEMRQAPDPRIPLEVAMVKLTRTDASLDALVERVSRLEAALANDSAAQAPPPTPAPPTGASASSASPAASSSPVSSSLPSSDTASGDAASLPSGADSGPVAASGGTRPADLARAQLVSQRKARASATGAAPRSAPAPAAARSAGPPPTPGSRPTPGSGAASSAGPPDGSSTGSGAVDALNPAADADAAPTTTDGDATGPPTSVSDTSGDRDAPVDTSSPAASDDASASASASPSEAPPSNAATASASETGSSASSDPAGGELDVARVTALWDESVLPSLGGLAKAMYAAGHVARVSDHTVTFALPNEVHREKCERKRAEVERALSDRVGAPVRLVLVVEGGASSDPGSSGRTEAPSAPAGPTDEPDDALGGADVHDLEDADAPAGGLDLLMETFDGAELVDDNGGTP